MSSSESASSARSSRSGARRTAGMPGRLDLAMSQPEPLTSITSCSTPRSSARVFTDVLPPPWSTSTGTAEEARGVDAERERLAHALLGISLDGVERADVIPSALHGSRCSTPRGKTQEQRLSPRDDAAATHCSVRGLDVLCPPRKRTSGAPKGRVRCARMGSLRRPAYAAIF